MSTRILLTMPQPGETITEGNVVRWMVSVGDSIKEGQHIVELETEKALFEYESPYEGQLVEVLAKEGDTVSVGDPIAVFEVDDAKAATYFMLGIGLEAGSQTAQKGKKEVKRGKPSAAAGKGAVKLSPLIRHMMQEYGIEIDELSQIKGTGPGGRITKENILSYLGSKKKAGVAGGGEEEIIPLSPIRLRIAENMAESSRTIPHAHATLTADFTKIVEYRDQTKDEFEKKNEIPLGILPLIFPALKKAISEYPLVNASFRDEGGKKSVVVHKRLNLGVAVDTPKGLLIPVVSGADQKDFLEFARDVEALLDRARNKRLTVQDLTGMTFTFNNYGYYATTHGVQIILPPQSATMGMGKIEKRPWVMDNQIQIRHLADLTLAFDHRVIDGRDAGLFLESIKKSVESFSEEDFV